MFPAQTNGGIDLAEENVAVLIDFENINNQNHMRALLDELSGIGRLTIKRAFGDWNKASTDGQQQLQTLGIELIHHSQTTSGKNASDIRLTIDAIDLLHTSAVPIDTFVIASGDSDFFPLITVLRSYGKSVVIAGRKNSTTKVLVNSCDRFIELTDLVKIAETPESTDGESNQDIGSQSPTAINKLSPLPANQSNTATNNRSRIPLDKQRLVIRAIQSARDHEGRVKGSKLHETIRRIDSSFNFRDHGFNSLSAFLNAVPNVKVKRPNGPGDITVNIA